MSNTEKKVLEISVESVISNPYQPRKSFSQASLKELSQSIRAYGVLQPISVRKIGEEKYELIAGERRVKAARLAELTTIPAIVSNEFSDKDSAILAIIENLQREDLNFIEEAEGYLSLIEDHGLTQQELSRQIGKNQSTIANKLRILRLDDEIKEELLEEDLTERHARALLKLPDKEMQLSVLKKITDKSLNVKKTEELIQNLLDELASEKNSNVKQRIKSFMNYKIYINTIKQAYRAIKDKQYGAEFEEIDRGDFIEVIVKIPKE